MKIHIELTDGHISAIQKELRVTCAMYKRFIPGQVPATEAETYALRILMVRRILDLSMSEQEACSDYAAASEKDRQITKLRERVAELEFDLDELRDPL